MNNRGELTFWIGLLWFLSVAPLHSAAIPFGLIAALTPVALIVVAKPRITWRDGTVLTGIVLLAAVAVMWLGRGKVESAPWILGMPMATAALVLGIWLLPQLILVTGYVRTFDDSVFELASLKRLQEAGPTPSTGEPHERSATIGGATSLESSQPAADSCPEDDGSGS